MSRCTEVICIVPLNLLKGRMLGMVVPGSKREAIPDGSTGGELRSDSSISLAKICVITDPKARWKQIVDEWANSPPFSSM